MIFAATVLLFIGALAFQWLAAPLIGKNRSYDAEIAGAQTRLARFLRLQSQKETLAQAYQSVFPGKTISLEGSDATQALFIELDTLAAAAGIRILDIRPQNAGADPAITEQAVDVRAEGPLGNIVKFVADIERSGADTRIKRFQVSVRPNTQVLEASLTLVQAEGL